MSVTWDGVHQHLLRTASSLSFQRGFELLRQQHPVLLPYGDPAALLDALHHGTDRPEQKNVILKTLVEGVHSDTAAADTAQTVILLALWPGLDAVRGRSIGRRSGAAADIASDILVRAIEAVQNIDLGRVQRIAATILMNIERDLRRDHAREDRRHRLRVDVDLDEIAGGRQAAPASVELLHHDVVRLVGGDADLVLRVAVGGFSQVEVAAELGLTEAAARKRYQRAIFRLRREYSDPVSRSGVLNGFSSAGAMAPSRKTDGAGFMTDIDDVDENDLKRLPGLFRRWEFSDVLETRRTYRLEEAGAHADGTPLVAIYTGTAVPLPTDRSACVEDGIPTERAGQ
jgi:RNA polymerase sigma-70 factor (ECF subfamily)